VKVIDFTELGLRGHQPPEVVTLIQYYFDDLSSALFEEFWEEHLETQYWGVAAGAGLLDRASLEAVPGTSWLSVFWGFDLLGGKGMMSLITEESHWRDTLSLKVHTLGSDLADVTRRMQVELKDLGPGPHRVYTSLRNFARLVARSRELQDQGYIEESFTLLMVAMESLLAESESISTTVSRRAGALVAISGSKQFVDSAKSVQKLYDARSKFVHEGGAIQPDSLKALREVCETVFFAAYPSQARSTRDERDASSWKVKWVKMLDYIAACFCAGVAVDANAAYDSGAPEGQLYDKGAAPN